MTTLHRLDVSLATAYLAPMQFTLAYASANFDELLARADNGEEVEITRDGYVMAKLQTASLLDIGLSISCSYERH